MAKPAINPEKLTPTELGRLLNSTELGAVFPMHRWRQQKQESGYVFGDGSTIDLAQYVGWMVLRRQQYLARPDLQVSEYDRIKERAAARVNALSASARNIGDLPAVENPERKAQAEHDFKFFCSSYFPALFYRQWSEDHKAAIMKIEDAVMHGGLFALAMPRKSGKTTLTELSCIWAIFYGHREFVCLIGASENAAAEMMDSIKKELDGNELLLADFPEIVFPIHCLDGISNRANSQLYGGDRTQMVWSADEVVLPTIPGSKASGAIIRTAGITGRIHGMKFKRPDGRAVRPSLVVIDDPQTEESAYSQAQCARRLNTINGGILNLAGPGNKISALLTCTVFRSGDLADDLLNRDKHPLWQGERRKLMYSFPTNKKLWDEYAKVLSVGLREDKGIAPATEFYRANRAAMDEGAQVGWPDNFEPGELSAVQYAMNLKIRDESTFYSQFQNEPMVDDADAILLTAEAVSEKLNGRIKNSVPLKCNKLTAFIDVQGKCLYYVVMAFEDDFTGYVIDYGTYPDQKLQYFTLRDVQHVLLDVSPGAGQEAAWRYGFEQLCGQLLGREYIRDDMTVLRISRCLLDANDGNAMDIVYEFCRTCAWPTVVIPSRGKGVGPANKPFADYRNAAGDRVGHNWRIPAAGGSRALRYLLADVNYWKSFTRSRWLVALGDVGSFSIYGRNPALHRMFADQLTAEYTIRMEAMGRAVDVWKNHVGKDNHFWDCVVGCTIAASEQGITLGSIQPTAKKVIKTIKFADAKRNRHHGRRV